MARFRRRKQQGVWLPPDPYNRIGVEADTPITSPVQNGCGAYRLDLPSGVGYQNAVSSSVVGDYTELDIAGLNGASLADQTIGYSLKRIVGKISISCSQNADLAGTDTPYHWLVTAGFIIRRVNEAGNPTALNINTDSYNAMRDPWIWRRSWVLMSLPQYNTNFSGLPQYPQANWQAASALDGPHVDAKTRRTVKAEERLFLDITATALDGTAGFTSGNFLYIYTDLRFFGRTFTSAGNRNNASR